MSGSDESYFIGYVAGWILIGGGVGYLIGLRKGNEGLGFLLGLLLGFVGWIIVAVLDPSPEVQARERAAFTGGYSLDPRASPQMIPSGPEADRRPCPSCAESIKAAAVICRFCGRPVEPVSPVRPVRHETTTERAPGMTRAVSLRSGLEVQHEGLRRTIRSVQRRDYFVVIEFVDGGSVAVEPWVLMNVVGPATDRVLLKGRQYVRAFDLMPGFVLVGEPSRVVMSLERAGPSTVQIRFEGGGSEVLYGAEQLLVDVP
jgi:hypothetical protein